MPKMQYISKKPQKKSLDMIYKIQGIIDEYREQGYKLTIRQAFYQLVSRDLISNTEKSYNEVIRVCKDGRLLGIIDWYSIVDRTRSLNERASWRSPQELMEVAAEQYHRDWWENQPQYVECFVEKEALADVVATAARKYDVPSFACKGYPSITSMFDTAERMKAHDGQKSRHSNFEIKKQQMCKI